MLGAVGCGKSNSITEDEENGILKTTVEILSNEIKRLEAENENLGFEISTFDTLALRSAELRSGPFERPRNSPILSVFALRSSQIRFNGC